MNFQEDHILSYLIKNKTAKEIELLKKICSRGISALMAVNCPFITPILLVKNCELKTCNSSAKRGLQGYA